MFKVPTQPGYNASGAQHIYRQ